MDLARQERTPQRADVEVFYVDAVEPLNQLAGELVMMIAADLAHPLVTRSDLGNRLAATIRPALTASRASLCTSQVRPRRLECPWTTDQFAGGQCRERGD